jgi:hypothetical protein
MNILAEAGIRDHDKTSLFCSAVGRTGLRPAAPKVARARSSDAGDITSKPMLIGYARVSTVDQNLPYSATH